VSADSTTVVDSLDRRRPRRSPQRDRERRLVWRPQPLRDRRRRNRTSSRSRSHPYAKHAAIVPNLPWFLSLLDDFALRIDTGGGHAPTFADGLEVQRQLEAIGYGR